MQPPPRTKMQFSLQLQKSTYLNRRSRLKRSDLFRVLENVAISTIKLMELIGSCAFRSGQFPAYGEGAFNSQGCLSNSTNSRAAAVKLKNLDWCTTEAYDRRQLWLSLTVEKVINLIVYNTKCNVIRLNQPRTKLFNLILILDIIIVCAAFCFYLKRAHVFRNALSFRVAITIKTLLNCILALHDAIPKLRGPLNKNASDDFAAN